MLLLFVGIDKLEVYLFDGKIFQYFMINKSFYKRAYVKMLAKYLILDLIYRQLITAFGVKKK